jgi:hypothetical protein
MLIYRLFTRLDTMNISRAIGVVVVIILIACWVRYKPNKKDMDTQEAFRMTQEIASVISDDARDFKGRRFEGAGLTPLSTPCRRSCAVLFVDSDREASDIRPGEL